MWPLILFRRSRRRSQSDEDVDTYTGWITRIVGVRLTNHLQINICDGIGGGLSAGLGGDLRWLR